MYLFEYAPWEYHPKFLADHEVKNPMLAISDFFKMAGPEKHRANLKAWKEIAVSNQAYSNPDEGAIGMFNLYEQNVRLIEALHLLLIACPGENRLRPVTGQAQIEMEEKMWKWFPSHLSYEELVNLFVTLSYVFSDIKLPYYGEQLYYWFVSAISMGTVQEVCGKIQINRIYKKQLRLYSAAWVIWKRETLNPRTDNIPV